jgi:hypothetical protein
VASVEALSGVVLLQGGPGEPAGPAEKGQYIRVGGRLETAGSGQATLALRNGRRLLVKPSTVILFRSDSSPKQLALALEQGTVESQASRVEASEVVIGLGQQKVRLPASASAIVSAEAGKIRVTLGQATVEYPGTYETRTVVESDQWVEVKRRALPPDAGAPDSGTTPGAVVAQEIVFYLQASGKGRVLIKRPGDHKFVAVKKGRTIAIPPGTEVRLVGRGTTVLVGPEKGAGTVVTGPAQVLVKEGPPQTEGGKPTVRLENTGRDMTLSAQGPPGSPGAPVTEEGVKVTTRITHRRLDVRLRRERGRTLLSVGAGEATLTGKDARTVKVEAGQEAILSHGKVTGPTMPPAAPLEVKSGGTLRVFAQSATTPVTFRWNSVEGSAGNLVEIGRSPSFASPIFSDVIQRRVVTLPGVGRGAVYWRVRSVAADGSPGKGTSGRLVLVKDTSHRVLKNRQPPRNTIHESFGNTTVYYQNLLPRFTFRWNTMEPNTFYQVKIFREQSLSKPLFTGDTKTTSLALPAGNLGEGSYIWYVVGRGPDGAIVSTSKSHRLSIHYDNATPDLQIVYPPNGAAVAQETLEARGVAIPGSKVLINGERADLDETFRFTKTVRLKHGVNHIMFLVVDPRHGSSYYFRQVTRN